MKIALFSSATDENKAIFVGQHGDENMFTFSSVSLAEENNGNIFVGHLADENTGHATVFSSARYWDPI
jgi:hypothetical protein